MPDKVRERYYLDAVLRALADTPSSEAFHDSETPDFLADTATGRLGIEITAFHLPPATGNRPHQEQQSLKDRIVERAKELHQAAGGSAFYVSVHFNPNLPLSRKKVGPLAEAIASCVQASDVPCTVNEPAVTVPWGKRPRETVAIHIQRSVDGKDLLWHADGGGWVMPVSSEHIEEVIGKKTKSLIKARRDCDELWLVIVNDNFSIAAQAEITEEACSATYKCPCDRLIWLLPNGPQAIDLKLERNTVTTQVDEK